MAAGLFLYVTDLSGRYASASGMAGVSISGEGGQFGSEVLSAGKLEYILVFQLLFCAVFFYAVYQSHGESTERARMLDSFYSIFSSHVRPYANSPEL